MVALRVRSPRFVAVSATLMAHTPRHPRKGKALLRIVPAPPLSLADLSDAAREYAGQARAKETIRATENDWKLFSEWCAARRLRAMPAEPATVAAFVTDQAKRGKALASILRYRASISKAHRLAGHNPPPTSDPRVAEILAGIRRAKGVAPPHQKDALTADRLRVALATLFRTGAPSDLRDRALLLVGLTSAMRRSELCNLPVDAIEEHPGGLLLTLARSKTDQE
ncbi:MAG: hypothetical protein Q8S13_01005, partial [Dehalococcoidia bacterium]|nr:hypothetical protein [Dehalococcoidia bacterium]